MEGTTVRASCPNCEDIVVTPADVAVRVCTSDESGSYAIRCPECLVRFAKPAPPNVVNALVAAGAPLTRWDLPAELLGARPAGPRFSDDDVEAFRSLLADDEWFDHVRSSIGD